MTFVELPLQVLDVFTPQDPDFSEDSMFSVGQRVKAQVVDKSELQVSLAVAGGPVVDMGVWEVAGETSEARFTRMEKILGTFIEVEVLQVNPLKVSEQKEAHRRQVARHLRRQSSILRA